MRIISSLSYIFIYLFFNFLRSKVQEQDLFRAFEDIKESSFHADQSLLADTGQLYIPLDLELLEGSFHEEDSLVRE